MKPWGGNVTAHQGVGVIRFTAKCPEPARFWLPTDGVASDLAVSANTRGAVLAWRQEWVDPDAEDKVDGKRPAHLFTLAFPAEE